MPAGIVTAGFVDVIHNDIQENEELKVSQANRQGRKMTKEDKRKYLVIMALGMIINLIFYSVARIFELPIFMNSVGTGIHDSLYNDCCHGNWHRDWAQKGWHYQNSAASGYNTAYYGYKYCYFLSAFALGLIDAVILIAALYLLYKITPRNWYIVKRYKE